MTYEELWSKFIAEYDWRKDMFNAVIEQMGGVDEYHIQTLHGIRNGQDGYGGFIYYGELYNFWRTNRDIVMNDMKEMSIQVGDKDEWEFVKNFNLFQKNPPANQDLALALYGNIDECEDGMLISCLGWYALEETAFAFHEWCYENNIDINNLNEEENESEGDA